MILLFPTLIDFKNEEDRKNFEPTYATLLLSNSLLNKHIFFQKST